MNYQSKYFPNGRDPHGNAVIFPGTSEGYPFRGSQIPNLKQDEYDNLEITYDSQTRIFDLSKPEELEAYNSVIDKCAKNLAKLRLELHEYDREKGSWRFLVQWLEPYGELPKNAAQHGGGYGNFIR